MKREQKREKCLGLAFGRKERKAEGVVFFFYWVSRENVRERGHYLFSLFVLKRKGASVIPGGKEK